jgi:hypothetical protein
VYLQALVHTRDRNLALTFAWAIAELPFDWTLLDNDEQPAILLARESFHLVFTDLVSATGKSMVRQARTSPLNNNAVIFVAAQDPGDPAVLQLGPDVVIDTDTNAGALALRVHQFTPLMRHERRWAQRCSVSIPLHLKVGLEYVPSRVLSLSEGGMMAYISMPISRSEVFSANLRLPGTTVELPLYGKIVWEGEGAKAGVRFLGMNEEQQQQLSDWLNRQTQVNR